MIPFFFKLFQLKATRIKLHQVESDHQGMIEDFNEAQKQLMLATKREVDSQKTLTITVICYYKSN